MSILAVPALLADLKVGDGPQVIGLRADMDAINLKETTGLPYQSLNPGKNAWMRP